MICRTLLYINLSDISYTVGFCNLSIFTSLISNSLRQIIICLNDTNTNHYRFVKFLCILYSKCIRFFSNPWPYQFLPFFPLSFLKWNNNSGEIADNSQKVLVSLNFKYWKCIENDNFLTPDPIRSSLLSFFNETMIQEKQPTVLRKFWPL